MKNRSYIVFYINEKRFEVTGSKALENLSDFLRYELCLTGTKVVCAEGDCGACTVLKANVFDLKKNKWIFKSVNSCILPLLSLDGCQVITVEALQKNSELHPVQKAMVKNFGTQCGYCTPGFVCSMVSLAEDCILNDKKLTEKKAKNFLTGNLCRCTGYDPIIKAALSIDLDQIETLQARFHHQTVLKELKNLVKKSVEIQTENEQIFLPTTLKKALEYKKKYPQTKLVAGATDLGVAINKGRMSYQKVMSLQNIEDLWKIKKNKTKIIIPARVTLAEMQIYLEKYFPEIARMLNLFASPQIKNSGTLVGNIVNASPISDTIPFLLVSDALVEIQSLNKKRFMSLNKFYLGYKKLNLKSNEIVTAIHLPLQKSQQFYKLYKVSMRKDLDISAVTMAARLEIKNSIIIEARLAFGGVGPIVQRLNQIEKKWIGQMINSDFIEESVHEIKNLVQPISDVRGSKEYRLQLCQNLLRKFSDEMKVEL